MCLVLSNVVYQLSNLKVIFFLYIKAVLMTYYSIELASFYFISVFDKYFVLYYILISLRFKLNS